MFKTYRFILVVMILIPVSVPVKASEVLLTACRDGDIALVKSELKAGASPNFLDDKGTPVIQVALSGRHFLIARMLLEEGAAAEKKDMKGRDALDVMKDAGRAPRSAVIRDLKKYVDMNIAYDIVKLLHYTELAWKTAEKEDVSARSGLMALMGMSSSQTPIPLNEMAKAQQIAIEMLAKSRAPVFAKLARNSADRAILMAEFAYGTIDDRVLLTKYYAYINSGRKVEVPKPPALKKDVTAGCKQWMNNFCSQYTHPKVADFAVFIALTQSFGKAKLGQDVLDEISSDYPVMMLRATHFRGPDGITELHLLCSNAPVAVVRSLLLNGADPNAISCSKKLGGTGSFSDRMLNDLPIGITPLHVATIFGKSELVETLLDFGANPNIQLEDGRTVLHLAASNGNEQIVKMLMKQGASVSTKALNGKVPAEYAKNEIIKKILESK
jgi:ankyrin repeat protein